MDFHEPDLEELITSDLHTEMNKILDQSETNCSSKEATEQNKMTNPNKKSTAVNQSSNHSASQLSASMCPSIKEEIKSEDVEILFNTCSSKPHDFSQEIEANQAAFSGHFSLEKYSASEDAIKQEFYQGEHSEVNDLSNLAWLTGVDVQQTLQPNSTECAIPTTMVEASNLQGSCMPITPNTHPSNIQFDCSTLKTQMDVSGQSMRKPVIRFTPIQPNVSYEDCQRYQLHQSDPIHRRLYPNDHRMGLHRGYHPYPPPPYGSSAASHLSDGFRHNRMHSQTKKVFPKPVYSYSCLIAMSLRASKTGCLPVSDIYNFMMENFPYFKTAPEGWKNSVRHNLSLNKCFEKVEKPNGSQRKGCLWALNPAKISKMEEEVQKWKRKDPEAIRRSMSKPEELDRELEEIRRADEEAARRRMLSMTTHGLSMMTPPPPGYNPYMRPNHLHPNGTTSLPTTPQHYHQQNPQSLPIVHGHALQQNPFENPNHGGHHPRKLFNCSSDQQRYSYGPSGSISNPIESGGAIQHDVVNHPNIQIFSSPYSSSSASSGNTSLLNALADTVSKSVNDLNDIDLDSSLADLTTFQGTLWDDPESGMISHSLVGDVDAFDNVTTSQNLHPNSTPSSSTLNPVERCASSDENLTEASIFEAASTRFPSDMPYMNSNGKTVALR